MYDEEEDVYLLSPTENINNKQQNLQDTSRPLPLIPANAPVSDSAKPPHPDEDSRNYVKQGDEDYFSLVEPDGSAYEHDAGMFILKQSDDFLYLSRVCPARCKRVAGICFVSIWSGASLLFNFNY